MDPESSILIDMNRAGVGLIEIVSAPEIESATEAASLISHIHELLQDTQVCTGLLEQGAMRVDVNVNWIDSTTRRPVTPRVELKNVNGIKAIQDAVTAELRRQRQTPLHELAQETRLFMPATQETVLLRRKGPAQSYRYLPEYDIPVLPLTPDYIEHVRQSMPKTRQQIVSEWCAESPQLKADTVNRLWTHPALPSIFARVLEDGSIRPEFALNWLVGDMLGVLNRYPGAQCAISSDSCLQLLKMLQMQQIDRPLAKKVLFSAVQNEADLHIPDLPAPSSAAGNLEDTINTLFREHPERVKFLQSQPTLQKGTLDFFIGRILRKHRGSVTVDEIAENLRQRLLMNNNNNNNKSS